MHGRISALRALVVVALLSPCARAGIVNAEPPPTPVAIGSEARASLLAQLRTGAGDMQSVLDHAAAVAQIDHLSLGDPRPVWDFAHRVSFGRTGVRLEQYLETTSQYLVPVLLDGEIVGLVRAYRRHDEGWSVLQPYDASCAVAVESLTPSDMVFDAEIGARDAMLVSSGESVFGIEACSSEPIPPVTTMTEYHQYIDDIPAFFPGAKLMLGIFCLGLLLASLLGIARFVTVRRRRGAT